MSKLITDAFIQSLHPVEEKFVPPLDGAIDCFGTDMRVPSEDILFEYCRAGHPKVGVSHDTSIGLVSLSRGMIFCGASQYRRSYGSGKGQLAESMSLRFVVFTAVITEDELRNCLKNNQDIENFLVWYGKNILKPEKLYRKRVWHKFTNFSSLLPFIPDSFNNFSVKVYYEPVTLMTHDLLKFLKNKS